MPNKFLTFGCPSYRSAAKLVGAIQMTSGGSAILLMIHFGLMGRLYSPEVSGISDHFWKFSIPTGVVSVFSMSLALLLLDGIYNKSIFQCRIWLAVTMVFLIVSILALTLALETEELVPLELKGIMILGMGLVMYMFWVVASYHKVLKAELANHHQQLPKLNNVANVPNDTSNSHSVSSASSATANNSNLAIALTTGIDEYESRTRAYTIST